MIELEVGKLFSSSFKYKISYDQVNLTTRLSVYLTEDTACMEEVRVSLCKNGDDCEEEDELQKEEEEGYPPAFYLDKVDLAPGQGYELVVSFLKYKNLPPPARKP